MLSEGLQVLKYVRGNSSAVIVLHEIYGINDFIEDVCIQYHEEGYDVFCPNLLDQQNAFPYAKSDEAYQIYMNKIGFDSYEKINILASDLKQTYAKVVVIGFSVGATMAWRCSENLIYDGVVCCYGSRIRDYLAVVPKCPALLIFAKHDSFDVENVAMHLHEKKDITVEILNANHGFADCYSENFSPTIADSLNKLRRDFLISCTK